MAAEYLRVPDMMEGCATVPTTLARDVFKVQTAVFRTATHDLF